MSQILQSQFVGKYYKSPKLVCLLKRQLYPKEAFLFEFNWFKISIPFLLMAELLFTGKTFVAKHILHVYLGVDILTGKYSPPQCLDTYLSQGPEPFSGKHSSLPRKCYLYLSRMTLMFKITFQNSPMDSPWPLKLLNVWKIAENNLLRKCYC